MRELGIAGRFYTADELRAILVAQGALAPRAVTLWDSDYRALAWEDFAEVVTEARLPDPPYHKERFDCDDHGCTFMGDLRRYWGHHARCDEALAMGWAWVRTTANPTGSHWVNWTVDNEGAVRYVEPQTNKELPAAALAAVLEMGT